MPEIEDISIAPDQGPLLLWWQWLIVALVVFLLLKIGLILWRRSRKKSLPPLPDPLVIALDELTHLGSEDQPQSYFATQLSLITRRYLQRAFGDPALFETSEEFHARSSSLQNLPEPAAQQIRSYLEAISQQKYAPVDADSHHDHLIQQTSELLREISKLTTSPDSKP